MAFQTFVSESSYARELIVFRQERALKATAAKIMQAVSHFNIPPPPSTVPTLGGEGCLAVYVAGGLPVFVIRTKLG